MSVAYLRERIRRLDEQYDRAPSTALLPEAGQYLGQIAFLGSHAKRGYIRRELHAAQAEAATLMGQLVWDASQRRDHDTAVAYFDQGILETAETQFAKIQAIDPAIDLFSPTQPGRLAGSCYLFLHDAKGAIGILEKTAQNLQDQSKSQAVVLGNLALAYIELGKLDAAVARLNQAIDVTERNRGGGGMNVICSAGRQLRRWRGSAEVQDAYDRIMTLMAA
jgi:tetratricopeptide (TPR) repeat protein